MRDQHSPKPQPALPVFSLLFLPSKPSCVRLFQQHTPTRWQVHLPVLELFWPLPYSFAANSSPSSSIQLHPSIVGKCTPLLFSAPSAHHSSSLPTPFGLVYIPLPLDSSHPRPSVFWLSCHLLLPTTSIPHPTLPTIPTAILPHLTSPVTEHPEIYSPSFPSTPQNFCQKVPQPVNCSDQVS